MKTLLTIIILSFTANTLVPQERRLDTNKLLSICRENAILFLNQKVNNDFDSTMVAQKRLKKLFFESQVLMIESKLKETLKNPKISKKNSEEIISLVFEQYRTIIPDIPESFYIKVRSELNI